MGIQGIYRELGPGQRVALSKLAADTLQTSNRPFRLAIDIAIWQFQAQAAKGGVNPAIRTLFYRLVRLMGTPIQPVFVFDGPNKPVIKRNKRSGRGDGVAIGLAKRLIRLFGFAIHDAPGEAEAECALLQKHNIVDAVLSEDVDTIMFGCTRTLRNWSAEGKGSKTPTHVTLYDVRDPAIVKAGLDREGMVLVALMSGGDYLPDGIPGCGIKVAYQAAIAGFGKSICRLRASDKDGIRKWRDSLVHELRTNESKFFRTRHKTLEIPDNFPNLEVLRYYTHPVVSPASSLDDVRRRIGEKGDFQLEALREFTRQTFDWDFRGGALKYIRVLGEALLVRKLLYLPQEAGEYVKRISTSRKHSSTDGVSELRLSYIPEEIVPIDISKEVEEEISYDRDGLALNSDDEFEEPDAVPSSQAPQKRVYKPFDITKPELAWVLEDLAKKAIPSIHQAWEDREQAKASRKAPAKKAPGSKAKKPAAKEAAMPFGSMNRFVRSTKASAAADRLAQPAKAVSSEPPEESSPPRRSTPRRSRTPPPREPSKQPTDPPDHAAAGTIAGSHVRARATDPPGGQRAIAIPSSPPAGPEAIVISSSPPGAAASPPPCQTPRRRAAPPRVGKTPSSIRSFFSPAAPSSGTGAAAHGRPGLTATPKGVSSPLKSPSSLLKQTTMDTFAKRLFPPTASQGGRDSASVDPSPPQARTTAPAHDPDDEESVIDLTPESPTSCRKRARGLASSPTSPRPTRKKLLIPIGGSEGFFDEVDVDLVARDRVATEQASKLKRGGARARVLRWSDLAMIDLTEAS